MSNKKTLNKKYLGFKVVREQGGKFVSAVSNWEGSHDSVSIGRKVEYKVGEWTKPPRDGYQCLFVFKSKKKAQLFAGKNGYHIFSCQIEEPFRVYEPWKEHYDPNVSSEDFPEGTWLTTGVKLLKEVKLLERI